MRQLLLTAILLAVMTAPLKVNASGARGGGDVIEIPVHGNQRLKLYDLVSQYTCHWITGRQMLDANPRLKVALNRIGNVDWYIALSLRREIQSLDFCLTGSLLPIYQKFKTTPNKTARRAAFRLDQNVLWDQNLADQLSAHSRAFLIIHEASHAFLTMNMNYRERYMKLWSAIKTLSFVDAGIIRSRDDLHYQLSKDSMEYPFATKALDKYKPQLRFLLSRGTSRVAMVLRSSTPEQLIALNLQKNPSVKRDLAPSDLARIQTVRLKSVLIRTLQTAMISGNLSDFKNILAKSYKTIDIALIALAVEPKLNQTKRIYLEDNTNFAASFNHIFSRLRGLKVTSSDAITRRPIVTGEFIRLVGANGPKGLISTPVIDLNASNKLATEFQGLAQIVAYWARRNDWYDIDQTVTNNSKFYQAISLIAQRRELSALSPAVTREKPLADQILKQLRDNLIRNFVHAVTNELGSNYLASKFKNRLNYNRFRNQGAH